MKVGIMKINIKTGVGSPSGLRAGLMKVFECHICGRQIEISNGVTDYRHTLYGHRICEVCTNAPLVIPDKTLVHAAVRTKHSPIGFEVGNQIQFAYTDAVVLRGDGWEIPASLISENIEAGESFIVLDNCLNRLWSAGNGKYCLFADHEKIEELCNAGQYDRIDEVEKTFTWFRE